MNPFNKTSLSDKEFNRKVKDFCERHVIGDRNEIVDYVLFRSHIDEETPFSYEDIENNGSYGTYLGEEVTPEQVEELFLEAESSDDQEALDLLKEVCFDCDRIDNVLAWIQVSEHLAIVLSKRGELILNREYWGRTESGISFKDSGIIQEIVSDMVKRELA